MLTAAQTHLTRAAARSCLRAATCAAARAFPSASLPLQRTPGLTTPEDIKTRRAKLIDRAPRVCDNAEEAVGPLLSDGCLVFIQSGAATPNVLIRGMIDAVKSKKLNDVRTIHMHLEGEGPQPKGDEEAAERIQPIAPFVGSNLRGQIEKGNAEYLPVHLGELPTLFRRRLVEPHVALLHVSPPDQHGNCTLGVSVDWAKAAAEHSKHLVGLVNPNMPRIFGDGVIHISQFDAVVHTDTPIYQPKSAALSKEEIEIGLNVASLVPDGATLQMGIGRVPDAALAALSEHKHLGIHTEMFSDGLLPLLESGVVDNSRKSSSRGVTVSSFVIGSQRLYDFCHDNANVNLLDVAYTNNVSVIASQHSMVGINSCIEMDLEGQAASSSIGKKIYSGFGGQVDFLRGAAQCPDGAAILAFTSRTAKGVPRVVPELSTGCEVVTTSAVVQYAVTEYGIAYLFGKTLPERAREMIRLSHPDDREELEKAAFARFGRAFTSRMHFSTGASKAVNGI